MQLARPGEVALALCAVEFGTRAVQPLLHVPGAFQPVPIRLPAGRHPGRAILQIPKLGFQLFQPLRRSLVIFAAQRFGLDLHLQDLPIQRIELFGLAVDGHAQPGGRLIHQVNRLVGQKPVGNVAVRQGCSRHQCRIRDTDPVVQLVFFLDAAQDRHGVFLRGLLHHHGLEPSGKGGILFHVLAVFIQRRGANAVQLPPRQGRLDQVGRIHCAIRFAGANERVHFVDEQDDVPSRSRDLIQDCLEAFLELAAILCACDQGTHIKGHQRFVAQGFRHIAIDNAQGEALGNCRFTNAGFTDQHRVVLGAARQHLHGTADLVIAANDRIDLALAGGGRQILGVFLERLITILCAGCICRAPLAQIIDCRIERLRIDRTGLQRILRGRTHNGKCGEQSLYGHKTVSRFLGDLCRLIEYTDQLAICARIGGRTADLGHFGQSRIIGLAHAFGRTASAGDQIGSQPFGVIEQGLEQMSGRQLRMAVPHGDGLCSLQEAPRPLRELLQVHHMSPSFSTLSCPRPPGSTRTPRASE